MAITAAIVMSSSTVNTYQKSTATLTVTNSGGSAISVTGIAPWVSRTTAPTQVGVPVNVGQPFIGPGSTLSVAGSSGTLNFTWDVLPMAPQVANYTTNPFPSAGVGGNAITPLPPEAMAQQLVYDVGATVYTADGSVTNATTATLTVNAGPKP